MKRAERLFHILAFAWQCNAFLPLLSRSSGDTTDLGAANPLATIGNAGVLGVVLVLMVSHWRMVLRLAPGMWPILGLVSLALLSTTWSDYPAVTVRRAGTLATITMWAWYVTARYDLKDIISIVRQVMWACSPWPLWRSDLGHLAWVRLRTTVGSASLRLKMSSA